MGIYRANNRQEEPGDEPSPGVSALFLEWGAASCGERGEKEPRALAVGAGMLPHMNVKVREMTVRVWQDVGKWAKLHKEDSLYHSSTFCKYEIVSNS